MKHIYLSIIFIFLTLSMYSQVIDYPLVKTSGTGETTINNFDYSHHSNYTRRIVKLTAKWKLTTLFGEPVIDGIFKWVAASNTPANYLDYRDCILLECSPVKSIGYSVYIKLSPTVPKSGEGYGYNTPGSPSWANVFCTRKGEDMTREIPAFTAATAKAIWKNGFRVTGIVLTRIGGSDGYLQAGKNNNSDNTAAQNDLKQKEAIEQQKQLSQQAKDKYNALKSPYTLNVNNRDTISEASLQAIKAINPYFQNGMLIVSSVNNGKVISKTNTVNANLQLAEGWNTLRIAIKGDNYNLKDSLRVYYKKDGRFGRMTDQQGNVYRTVKIGNQVWMAENLRTTIYNDGSEILHISNNEAWDNTKEGAYCNYDNNNFSKYIKGCLYNYRCVRTNKLAPKGWHIPTKIEWEILINFIGGKEIAGAKLKENGSNQWNESNISSTNEYGFTALPSGFRNDGGDYYSKGAYFWWSFNGSEKFIPFYVYSNQNEIGSAGYWANSGCSVRCVKD